MPRSRTAPRSAGSSPTSMTAAPARRLLHWIRSLCPCSKPSHSGSGRSMTFETHGQIDIVPPLAWSEVSPTGFMVMANGSPVVPAGQWVALTVVEDLVDRPEGTLHRFRFTSLVAAQREVPLAQRETMRVQVAAIVAAFPTHVFGGVERVIRFRGNELDDVWRIGLL